MRIAAIDQGTTATKALVVASDGTSVSLGQRRHRQILPAAGRVEHDPRELLLHVRELAQAAAGHRVDGIALANQGETVVAWDRRDGRPLANAIVWQDRRTTPAVEALAAAGASSLVLERCGLPLDPYFSASKLRWLLDHADGARELARRGRLGLGTSDSWLVERLTGRYATDPTTAGRTALMNLATSQWDEDLCALFGVPPELLPEIAPDDAPIGALRLDGHAPPLLVSVVDQVAALHGHGCRRPGEGKVTVGTGAFALMIAGFAPPPGTAGIASAPGWRTGGGRAYLRDGGVYSAGAAVEWLLRVGLLRDLAEIDGVDGPSAAQAGLFFVPALAGLACPHWDRSAAGLFIGLDAATGRQDLVKAVLEGVAFRIAEVIDAVAPAVAPSPLSADGGLMRSTYFGRFLARVLGRPLVDRSGVEVTALGAAALAHALAAGRDAGVFTFPREATPRTIAPEGAAIDRGRFTMARERAAGWR
jgi:glycerol kinase